jgi:phosphotransferase family enzyme
MRVRTIRSHRHRCTFEVSFGPEDDERRVIAKVYDEDRSDVFGMMESVLAAGFNSDALFAIASPLAYLHSPRILVQEKVPGTEAVEIFRGDDMERQIEAARRCGTWLGHFHTKALPQGGLFGPDRVQFAVRYWAQEVRDANRLFADKAERLLRKLEAAAPAVLGGFEPRAGHGTYMPEHVVLSGARTVSIDLDEYHIADPAQDLAWFIVSLERLGLENRKSIRVYDRAIEEFLRGYAASGPQIGLSHLPFFRAVMFLFQAHRDLYRYSPFPEWSEIMLDEGIDSLGRDDPDRGVAQMSPT